MRVLIFVLVLAAASASGQHQQHLNPIGSQGNILHPGIPMSGPPRAFSRPGGGAISRQGRTVYVPYGVPIDPFYSGYNPGYNSGYGYGAAYNPGPYDPSLGGYYPGGGYAAPEPAPTVVINQNFLPDPVHPVMHDYTNTPLPPSGAVGPGQSSGQVPALRDDQPTVFLIAMKDHTIYPVIAYWVDKDTLNYVTVESTVKRVPMDQVDRDLSRQLNDQRNVEFKLPAPVR